MAIRKRDRVKVAKKRAAAAEAPRKRAVKSEGEKTLQQLTAEFNAMVPAAEKKGIKGAKHHTSSFGSLEHARNRVAWLREQLGR